MELTKEQVKYIDHLLENEGIKFWDIRIEMLDHVVTKVEKKLKLEHSNYQFKELVQDAFVKLGWKENFNGGGLDHVFQKTLSEYSKNNRKNILEYYKTYFRKLKSLFLILIFWTYLFINYNNVTLIKYTLLGFLCLFLIFILGFFLKYKVFQSSKLNSLIFLVSLPIALLNIALNWPKVFFGFDKLSNLYVIIISAIVIPFLVIGMNFIYEEFKIAQNIYKKLIK
ncbi:hypothetical protein [uncultured Polaribacter sp.]|uniref:hypothetical protein n=1 Tax=uncultured Polaribacter sp. TaxID=174711 RepID=UPI002628F5F5|nr:hypothetical protein [uncultured Polaribacter sp.]